MHTGDNQADKLTVFGRDGRGFESQRRRATLTWRPSAGKDHVPEGDAHFVLLIKKMKQKTLKPYSSVVRSPYPSALWPGNQETLWGTQNDSFG